MREMVHSGTRGGEAVKTHFMLFMTLFEHGQLVPGGESRETKSLKEDTTKYNILGQMTPTEWCRASSLKAADQVSLKPST